MKHKNRDCRESVAKAVHIAIANRRFGTALLIGTGCALVASVVSGQTVDQTQNPAQNSAQPLEEVTVTATRRDESILNIPYAISAVSADTLVNAHVETITDLSQVVAGVSFVDQGPTSRSNFVLRGINADASDVNGPGSPSNNTPPVSTYLGETPLFVPLQTDDLQRVEVLRGPQGTLYGSGSLAGTIRFIPNNPDPSGWHGNFDVEGADVAHTSQFDKGFDGMINVPIGDTMAFRVNGAYKRYAGFINENYIVKLGPPSTADNSPVGIPVSNNPNDPIFGGLVFTPIKDANDAEVWHTRASFLWRPSAAFSAIAAYFHQDTRQQAEQASSPNFVGNVDTPCAGNPFCSPAYPVSFPTGGITFPHNGTYDANDSFLLSDHRKTDLVTLDMTGDLGFASLTSDTSWYEDNGNNVADGTGLLTLYPSFYGFIPRMVDYETGADGQKGIVEELRLVSKTGGKFDYVAGLFYQHVKTDGRGMQWVPGQTYFGGLVGAPGGNAATLGDVNDIGYSNTDFKDAALFGELTYHLTSRWQVTGGTRLFKQKFSIFNFNAFPYCGSFCGDNGNTLGSTTNSAGYSANDHIFKLNTSYKFADTLTAYINYAQGFRRGGSNALPISGPFAGNPALLVYTPDKTNNYEIGAKGTVGPLNFTAAVFYIDWNNFQVNANAVASGASIVVNGKKARSKGFELELNGRLLPGLTYDLGYSYAHAEVAENFAVIDYNTAKQAVAIVTAASGDPLPNAPESSFTAALDYGHPAPMLSNWQIHYHINTSYRSSTLSRLVSTDPQAPPPFEIDAFWMTNAAVTLMSNKGVSIELYGKNLFDVLGITGGVDAAEVGVREEHFFLARPRTIGLRLGYQF